MRGWLIERTSEAKREFWTGRDWSEHEEAALWYEREPDSAEVTEDENAQTVFHESTAVDH